MTDREFDLADLEDEESQPIPFLPLMGTPGYFVEKWTHIISAFPRTGKTEVTMMGVEEWLQQGKTVLWLSEESHAVWVERMKKRRKGLGRSFPAGCRVYLGWGQKPEELLMVMQLAEEPIVVVDTLRAMLQPKDETDNSEMVRVLTPWISEQRKLGKTLIFLHHARKGGGTMGEAAAGGHAIVGAMDVIMDLTPYKGSRERGIIKVRARLITTPDMIFRYDPETTNITPELPAAARVTGRTRIEQQILDQMPAGALYKTGDIERLLQPTPARDTVTRSLVALAQAGLMTREPPLSQESVAGMTVRWMKHIPGNL